MKAKLIRIGNSKGIRIPKPMIDQFELGDEVELLVSEHGILIRASDEPRQGWEDAFKRMAENGDSTLVDGPDVDVKNEWDDTEWTW